MSSQNGENTKQPRSEGGALFPVSKRQKITSNVQSNRSLLLETCPEILRKMYSFLTLKEAVVLRSTHRQFNQASNDIYQYTVMMSPNLDRKGYINYIDHRTRGLCNLSDNTNLQAVLQNVGLDFHSAKHFIEQMTNYSKTDNGEAISILLKDGRSEPCIEALEMALRKGFTAMAAVLQRHDRVKKDIKKCKTCSNNIGCFWCANEDENYKGERQYYCRECVLKDARFCELCNAYLCPTCYQDEKFDSCGGCDGFVCRLCEGQFLMPCTTCARKKCKFFVGKNEENGVNPYRHKCGCPVCRNRGRWVYL